MRVIGVLDLLGGRAVHARGGRREAYEPVHAVMESTASEGDAVGLARDYLDRFGITELYVADLDAILGQPPQRTLVGALTALGAPLWLDTGVRSRDRARQILDEGVTYAVIGLETLPSYRALQDICAATGPHAAFSLDVRHGRPVITHEALTHGGLRADEPVETIAARAGDAGVTAVIVIDLARVGAAKGPDLELLVRVRQAVPGVTLVAGGGIRGIQDLEDLVACGCDGALVATALHDGRLNAAAIAAARDLTHGRAIR